MANPMERAVSKRIIVNWIAVIAASAMPVASAALTVTQPTAATVVAAGDDFATQVLGNAWDMKDSIDIDTEESLNVTSQSFVGGVFSGLTTAADANLYPLFEGQLNSINLSRGANFPVDTSHYRYFTVKMKATQPGAPKEYSRLVFYQVNGTFGLGLYHALPNNAYIIFTNDMYTQIDGTSPHTWLQFPQVTGLRLDPATPGGAFTTGSQFSIAWVRLTAPATAAQTTTVAWTDSGYTGSYNISANDAGGTSLTLASNVSGASYVADLSRLPPGAYTITVARSNNSATAASASFHINTPPQIAISQPSASGDLTQDFAKTVVGNPWGPIDANDFLPSIGIRNFNNVSYNNPVDSFYGRPINNDPGWWFYRGSNAIDAGKYRSVCYAFEVFGPRNIGAGSVARIFWGSGTAQVTTSLPIPVDDNANDTLVGHYCIADLAAYPPDPKATIYGPWAGMQSVFRLDPDEFTPPSGCSTADTCHDVRLDSVTLSPFALANPGYTFNWTFNPDPDSTGDTVDVYLDPDATPTNGNEIYLGSTTASTGSFAWAGSCAGALTYGPWHVLMVASDGINPVSQYAGGPVLVARYDGIFRNGFESIPATCP